MLKLAKVPVVNGIGKILSHLENGSQYTFIDHGYYIVALKPGETEAIKPELPEQEWKYRNNVQLRNGGRTSSMKFYEFRTEDHDYYALISANSPDEAVVIYKREIDNAFDKLNPHEVSLTRAADITLEAHDLEGFRDALIEKEKQTLQEETTPRVLVIDSNLL